MKRVRVEGYLDIVDGAPTFIPKSEYSYRSPTKRVARKTTQYNFRCAPEWKVEADMEAKRRGCSVSTLMELGLAALKAQRK